MSSRRWLVLVGILILFVSGCVLGDSGSDNANKTKISNINQLTMGGGVFVFGGEGFGTVQVGIFNGTIPYEDATVFVNGSELTNALGIHTNAAQLSIDTMSPGEKVRIAVYAVGDSVIQEITVPDTPVIVKPEEDDVHQVGDQLPLEIGYPGAHDFISFSLAGQKDVLWGAETGQTLVQAAVPGESLPNVGTFQLMAMSVNTSGKIPNVKNFNVNSQYELFLVTSVAVRNVKFVGLD